MKYDIVEDEIKIGNKIIYGVDKDILDIIHSLEKENQELKEKVKTYEDPEDLTLMFMYCNEKAKDKIRKLENQQKEFIEYLEEEMEKNINWYNSLTPHDKNYYYKDYVDKDRNYMAVLSKHKEIIGNNEQN
ncbi:MAG: hypothetical protein ACI31S_01970 [Bacilli bacterium]